MEKKEEYHTKIPFGGHCLTSQGEEENKECLFFLYFYIIFLLLVIFHTFVRQNYDCYRGLIFSHFKKNISNIEFPLNLTDCSELLYQLFSTALK